MCARVSVPDAHSQSQDSRSQSRISAERAQKLKAIATRRKQTNRELDDKLDRDALRESVTDDGTP